MLPLTPEERRRRDRIEAAIRIAEPVLDLVLKAGERFSRLLEREDHDYYPPQRGHLPSATSAPPRELPASDRGSGRP